MISTPLAGLDRFWRAGVDRCRDVAPGEGTDRKVSVFGYLFLGLNLLFFAGLTVAAPDNFEWLNRKDSWVESFTALWFFLGGLLLWATATLERSWWRRVVYGLGGIALVVTAGEEISWGQTFFIWLESPDFMVRLAKQNDFVAHNDIPIPFFFFNRYGILLLAVLAGVFFFCGKNRIAGIPLPSVMLTLGLLAALADHRGLHFAPTAAGREAGLVPRTFPGVLPSPAAFRQLRETALRGMPWKKSLSPLTAGTPRSAATAGGAATLPPRG